MTKFINTAVLGNRRGPAPRFDSIATEACCAEAHSDFLNELPDPSECYSPKHPAAQGLKSIIELYGYQAKFNVAIYAVAQQNLTELKRITTLDQFYYYVDMLETWIPEIRHWEVKGEIFHERTIYLRIVQFYYYFNHAELQKLQSPMRPIPGKDLTHISVWLRDFAVSWGNFLDTPASKAALASFKYAPEYNYQDYEKEPENYATFNEFFARTFKNIDIQRPIAQQNDDDVIVFPAESTFVGQWTISTDVPGGPMPAPPSIVVKHIEWPIRELLNDSQYAKDFAGGRFCHSFLNTYDYHRMHTPVKGEVLEAKFIPGQVYLEVELKEQGVVTPNGDLANTVIPKRYLDADDPTGYQFVQCRGLIVLKTEHFGKVAVLPMGMAQVSSVVFTYLNKKNKHTPITLTTQERDKLNYDEQVKALNAKIASKLVGKTLEKGEMFSFFQFGGSDCVVVFERRANVNITAQTGVHYPIRSQYGNANYDKG